MLVIVFEWCCLHSLLLSVWCLDVRSLMLFCCVLGLVGFGFDQIVVLRCSVQVLCQGLWGVVLGSLAALQVAGSVRILRRN
ncbi:hypothetical protein A2U01_0025671 [Trifolium medium]|uniref:Uncharacterized protein n=1 Tax=Trifolium medium TaxID=97028 RepID=A0A392NYV9_9FABA|nr:hypothetical protein [Trifolium medium]